MWLVPAVVGVLLDRAGILHWHGGRFGRSLDLQGCPLGVVGWEPLWKSTCQRECVRSTEECGGECVCGMGVASKVYGECQNWCLTASG